MNRRSFLAALVGAIAAPKVLESLKPTPSKAAFIRWADDYFESHADDAMRYAHAVGKQDAYEAYYTMYSRIDCIRPDRRGLIINLTDADALSG